MCSLNARKHITSKHNYSLLKKLGKSHDIPQVKAKNHGPKKTIKGKTTK